MCLNPNTQTFFKHACRRDANLEKSGAIVKLKTKTKTSVQFSHSVVSDSLWPHESQHARPPCPSPTPGVHPDSRPSSQWCHPAISSSVVPFSSCPKSLPASVISNELTLHMRWPKYWSFSFSNIPSKEIPGSEWTGWISLQSKGHSRVFSNTTAQKHLLHSAFFTV